MYSKSPGSLGKEQTRCWCDPVRATIGISCLSWPVSHPNGVLGKPSTTWESVADSLDKHCAFMIPLTQDRKIVGHSSEEKLIKKSYQRVCIFVLNLFPSLSQP